MAITTQNITGCCVSQNFYNLGGAHGYKTAVDLKQFEDWLAACHGSTINIALTNEFQGVTRGYLEACGWETKKVGTIYISTISGDDFYKFKTKVQARQRDERNKKLADERRRLAEIAEKRKFQTPKTNRPATVTELDIQRCCNYTLPVNMTVAQAARTKDNLEKTYQINLDGKSWLVGWYGDRSFRDLRRYIYDQVRLQSLRKS